MYCQAKNPAPVRFSKWDVQRYFPLFWPAQCWKCSSRWLWAWGWKTPRITDIERYNFIGCLCYKCAPNFDDANKFNNWTSSLI